MMDPTDTNSTSDQVNVPEVEKSNPLDQYWAACDSDDIGSAVMERVDQYYTYLQTSNLVDLWRKSYYAYYSMDPRNASTNWSVFAIGSLYAAGTEGEIAKIKINHFRNFVTHVHVLITQQRPAMKCRAINSDTQSLTQALLGDGILDFFMREKHLEQNLKDGAEIAILMGEAFTRLDWDAKGGKPYGIDSNGQPIFDGDVVVKTYNPFDVCRDVTRNGTTNHDWYVFHDQMNKFDMAAKYPSVAEEVIQEASDVMAGRRFFDPTKVIASNGVAPFNTSDQIDVYTLVHKHTAACPSGRMTITTQSGLVLFDGPLPFKKMPVSRISAGEVIGAPFGWTVAFDGLAIQEAIDKLYSMWLTNNMAAGIQCFWSPPGNQVDKTSFGPLTLIESPQKPEVLNLCATPGELPNLINKLEQDMGTLFSISDVNRGDASEKGMSGSALALLASQAITFSSNLQASYNQQLEDIGSLLIDILKEYAATPRLAGIAGNFNRPAMEQFVGKDLVNIDRVIVEATSAISRTAEGKIQLAQMMLATNPPMITTPRELLQVITTGNLEVLYEGDQSSLLLIKAENDNLRKGAPVKALKTDMHPDHVTEHKTLLDNPQARMDPQLCQRVLAHIDEHIQLELQLQQNEPALLAMLREAPIPAGQPQQQPQPSPQQPPGASGPQGMAQLQNPNAQPNQPRQPGLPKLPSGTPPQIQAAYNKLKGQ